MESAATTTDTDTGSDEMGASKDKRCIVSEARVIRSWEELAAQGHKSGEEPWAHQCLYSRYHSDVRARRYLKTIEWKPPSANKDLSITIHKCARKKAETCLICGNHRSRARQTCVLCKGKLALPSCRPEFCWMQIDDELGACRRCFLELLHSRWGEPATIIMSMLGDRYGAIVSKKAKPPRDMFFHKALGVMLEDAGNEA